MKQYFNFTSHIGGKITTMMYMVMSKKQHVLTTIRLTIIPLLLRSKQLERHISRNYSSLFSHYEEIIIIIIITTKF